MPRSRSEAASAQLALRAQHDRQIEEVLSALRRRKAEPKERIRLMQKEVAASKAQVKKTLG